MSDPTRGGFVRKKRIAQYAHEDSMFAALDKEKAALEAGDTTAAKKHRSAFNRHFNTQSISRAEADSAEAAGEPAKARKKAAERSRKRK